MFWLGWADSVCRWLAGTEQMALLQLSYVVVRLLQEFEAIEAVDTKPVVAYGTNLVLTPVDGVHVRLS